VRRQLCVACVLRACTLTCPSHAHRHALKTNAECQVECMATYGQRGCCSVVGVTSANNTRDNSDDEREHSASGDSSADDVVRDENETDTVESRHESDSISDE
jgi:hypothetical protein